MWFKIIYVYQLTKCVQFRGIGIGPPIDPLIKSISIELDKVLDGINNIGYGLTFGIHSRISTTVAYSFSSITTSASGGKVALMSLLEIRIRQN